MIYTQKLILKLMDLQVASALEKTQDCLESDSLSLHQSLPVWLEAGSS